MIHEKNSNFFEFVFDQKFFSKNLELFYFVPSVLMEGGFYYIATNVLHTIVHERS